MEDTEKIGFFKTILYSISKPSKYQNMNEQGVAKAFKYFFTLVSLLAIIISVAVTSSQIKVASVAIDYLDENLPQITFKENVLQLENDDAIILDDKKITDFFGYTIVINTVISKEEAIENYKELATEQNNVIVFLREEFFTIPKKNDIENNTEKIVGDTYSNISSGYVKDQNYQYEKKDLINYLKQRISFAYFVAQFFIIYFIRFIILYLIYILFISTSVWIVSKLFNNKWIKWSKWKYKEALESTIYASTLSILIYNLYTIVYYFSGFVFHFIDITSIALVFIYIYILIFLKNKKERQENI